MRALITGAGGFAGSYLAEYLLREGLEVNGLVSPQDGLARLAPVAGDLHIERGDIRDQARVADVVRTLRPEHIYHLAGITSPADSLLHPKETYDANFLGTLNLLDAIRALKLDCHFLLVSSPEVYGIVQESELPLREDSPLRPANPYGGSKAASELLASQFFRSYKIPIVIVRPFNHTGPRQSEAFVCSGLARQVAEIELCMRMPVIEVGNLSASRDFTDVRDIVHGYYLLLKYGQPGEIYQLCAGERVSIELVLQSLMSIAGVPIEVMVDKTRVRGHGSSALGGTAEKAERAVGWKKKYPLQTTLRDLLRFWESTLGRTASV